MAGSGVNYNDLHLIAAADAAFYSELANAHIKLPDLLAELSPLFLLDQYKSLYAVCLIHRHYTIQSGEIMVTRDVDPLTDDSGDPSIVARSRPERIDSIDALANIIPERWLKTGQAIEFRYTDCPSEARPPPQEFLNSFNAVVERRGITMLGISYAPTQLSPSEFFLESVGDRDREQVIQLMTRPANPSTVLNSPPTNVLRAIENNPPGSVSATFAKVKLAPSPFPPKKGRSARNFINSSSELQTFQSAWSIIEQNNTVPVMDCSHVCCNSKGE